MLVAVRLGKGSLFRQLCGRVLATVIGVKVERPLPTHPLAVDGSAALELAEKRRGADLTRALELIYDGVGEGVVLSDDLVSALPEVAGVVVELGEALDLEIQHVSRGMAVHYPLGCYFTHASGALKTKGCFGLIDFSSTVS